MMLNFLISLIGGAVMGSATVFYITQLTRGMEFKKRLKVISWVGIPAGMIMTLLAQMIGRYLL